MCKGNKSSLFGHGCQLNECGIQVVLQQEYSGAIKAQDLTKQCAAVPDFENELSETQVHWRC